MAQPPGLSINPSSGVLAGTVPASAVSSGSTSAEYSFTVEARTASGLAARRRQTITVWPLPTVVLTAPAGQVGVAYVGATTATGGSSPKTYSVPSGALPTGVSINAGTGSLTGTPTVAGTYTGVIRVAGAYGGRVDTAFSITIS